MFVEFSLNISCKRKRLQIKRFFKANGDFLRPDHSGDASAPFKSLIVEFGDALDITPSPLLSLLNTRPTPSAADFE